MSTLPEPKPAEIVAEYGPFDAVDMVHGVTFDGTHVWLAHDGGLLAFDPAHNREVARLDVDADAGTAFDGKHLWQIVGLEIRKLDRRSGEILATLPAPRPDELRPRLRGRRAVGRRVQGPQDPQDRRPHRPRAEDDRERPLRDRRGPSPTASSGTGPWTTPHRRSGAWTRRAARCWSGSRCRRAPRCPASRRGADVFYVGAHRQARAAVRAVRRPKRGVTALGWWWPW